MYIQIHYIYFAISRVFSLGYSVTMSYINKAILCYKSRKKYWNMLGFLLQKYRYWIFSDIVHKLFFNFFKVRRLNKFRNLWMDHFHSVHCVQAWDLHITCSILLRKLSIYLKLRVTTDRCSTAIILFNNGGLNNTF